MLRVKIAVCASAFGVPNPADLAGRGRLTAMVYAEDDSPRRAPAADRRR